MFGRIIAVAILTSMLSLPISSFAAPQKNTPFPEKFSTCKKFLENDEVVDQIKYEALNLADDDTYTVTEDKGICTLTAEDKDDNITYKFTSVSLDNYKFDGKTFTLSLYDPNKPTIENIVEGTYDVDTDDIIDAAYSFPSVEHTAAAESGADID